MSHYLVSLDLRNRNCVVVGGGAVAERKVETLLECGAVVVVVAPTLTARLEELAARGEIRHVPVEYRPGALDGAFLVVGATDDPQVNEAVSMDARKRGILVNIVDAPELCTFFVPATARRGDLVIAVSTSGKSPALARRIREELESRYGPEYGELADLLGELREEVRARYADQDERNRAFVRILDSDVLGLLAEGRRDEAREKARKCI